MATAQKLASHAHAACNLEKEIIYAYGISLGLIAGGLWKLHRWNNQKRAGEFYDLPQKGSILVVEMASHNFDDLIPSLFLIKSADDVIFLDRDKEPRATLAGRVCTNRTADQPNRRIFINNFLAALDGISPQISSRRYGTIIKGTGNNTVYAFGECMKDLSQRDCDQCFAQCKTDILRCLPFQMGVRGGRNYFDGCYLRYDDYNFFQENFSQGDRTVCVDREFNGSQSIHAANVRELVGNLSNEAVKNDGFFVGSLSRRNVTVYGLAQCWETISRNSCDMCLKNASAQIQSCSRKEEGRVLNAGCYMRYSPQRFYNNTDVNSDGGGSRGRRRLAIILAVVFSALAALMIFASCAFFGKRKLTRRKKERKQLGALAATVKRSDLNFKYEVLERATKYFDSSNKLGQGGSGSVYKGTLPDGKHIAVKRLIFSTRQWVDQFFNEVNLISAVHHKNLVKLLGCSITGPESLLVYEYIPNLSLQENLFSYILPHVPTNFEFAYFPLQSFESFLSFS
ncbi:Cysteine-rich receptor-like protein kinase [Thalictrum thalictroides]|uniref:Cysteine-rich receptor-like protein kinase n=1 Tax=Thalictrum thalictroides TaxID=46969 RepID=A0A7J6WDK0_THATH|nr:Cysteine-rich receptor-like protein kinase [Thalictrum thalictroides]